MKKLIVFSIFLVILILGLGIFFYFFYERSAIKSSEIQYHDVNIRFINNNTKKEVFVSYDIFYQPDRTYIKTQEYYGQGYNIERIKVNRSFSINYRNSSSCFYPSSFEYEKNDIPQTIRVDIELEPCGLIIINHSGMLLFEEPITINLTSVGKIKNPALCLSWSKNLLSVSIKNLTKINVVDRLKDKVVKCYDTRIILTNNSTLYNLDYILYKSITQEDFIILYILDGDISVYTNEIVYENEYRQDFALDDVKYLIR